MNLFFSKLKKSNAVLTIVGCATLVFLGYTAYVGASTSDVTGYACSQNIGCISLNSQTSQTAPEFNDPSNHQPASFGVTYNDVTNSFGGMGWSPIVGDVLFGQSCGTEIEAAQSLAPGAAKCATIPSVMNASAAQAGGWKGIIYLGGVVLGPDHINFIGRGWEGIDTDDSGTSPSDVGVGWLDFVAVLQGDNGACGNAISAIATSAPVADLCSVGIASTPTQTQSGAWTWSCTGSITAATCTTLDPGEGLCGTAANTVQVSQPTTNLCAVGTASAVSPNAPYSWTCTGTNNNPKACAAFTGDMDGICTPGGCGYGSPYNVGSDGLSWWCPGIGNGNPTECIGEVVDPAGPIKPIYKEN